MLIRSYEKKDLKEMTAIWNEVVADGIAFPQEDILDETTGAAFFAEQSYCGVATDDNGNVVGLYILHPNNIGRCGHLCNASYAVKSGCRGRHIGEALVTDCMERAAKAGFRILQFNAVVESNLPARRLYEKLGFRPLGVIEGGFRTKSGEYVSICPYYIPLRQAETGTV